MDATESRTYIHTEPGYYADGRFGVRIESVVVVRKTKTLNNFGAKGYLGFEHLTLVRALSTYDKADLTDAAM
jgi:Xaa-Pro aminopeptidase